MSGHSERIEKEHREMQEVIVALLNEFDHPPRAVRALPIIAKAYEVLERARS